MEQQARQAAFAEQYQARIDAIEALASDPVARILPEGERKARANTVLDEALALFHAMREAGVR